MTSDSEVAAPAQASGDAITSRVETDVTGAEWRPTACILCECNCGLEVRLDRYQNGPHRLTSPLRRRSDGSFEEALAQEKTGEFWVDARLYGGHTRGDFEHAEVSLFVGKNPWMSHGMPRARPTLREIARDPARALIVIDPRRTETAALADHHLALRPGTDAWCLAALCAVIVQEGLTDAGFLAARTTGADEVAALLGQVPVEEYAAHCGLDPDDVRTVARRIAAASSFSTFEDLGMQQAPHSTLSSYLNKLLFLLVGSFAKPGAMGIHSDLVPLTRAEPGEDAARTPVSGARVIAGLIPANVVAEEILDDHPARYRAMVVQSANPAHSVADSQSFRRALEKLDLVVCIDVAMTKTARLADYVLPAAGQYEKWECTWFNFEFPRNTFHLRAPLLDPMPGTLPEAEIYARLLDRLGAFDGVDLDGLADAALRGRSEFAAAFGAAAAADVRVALLAAAVLYRTLGATLPDGAAAAAPLWGIARRAAAAYPDAVRRAGCAGRNPEELGESLFDGMLAGRRGITFTVEDHVEVWARVSTPDGRINLVIPELLTEFESLAAGPARSADPDFPLVLAAGERRAFTANTIFRDPAWRRREARGGLRVSPADADALGFLDGDCADLVTRAGRATVVVDVDEAMPCGAIALPNGFGVDFPDERGNPIRTGVAPNELTRSEDRDPIAGTPWHKHVPARLEPLVQAGG